MRPATGVRGPRPTLTVKRGLFADGFDAGTLAAWTGGTVPTTPGTRLQVQAGAAAAGGFGLAVTGSTTTQATVQTPAVAPAATGYHARFAFNPNTLRTTGTNGRTGILTGISGTSTQAFQVQYQRASAGAPPQVRLFFSNTRVTPWVTVNNGWNSIQVDWVTSKTATLTLTVNGVASTVVGANTKAMSITSAQLGIKTPTGNVTGTAWFDTFVSSLNPLP